MTLEIEVLNLIVQIISLILLFITSLAGIKYILSNWKINKLAKKFEKFSKKEIDRKSLDEVVQKLAMRANFRKNAKMIIEGIDTNIVDIATKIDNLQYSIDNLNDTLKRFKNYKEKEYSLDISQKDSKKDL